MDRTQRTVLAIGTMALGGAMVARHDQDDLQSAKDDLAGYAAGAENIPIAAPMWACAKTPNG